jgi:hypothetical protein
MLNPLPLNEEIITRASLALEGVIATAVESSEEEEAEEQGLWQSQRVQAIYGALLKYLDGAVSRRRVERPDLTREEALKFGVHQLGILLAIAIDDGAEHNRST